MTVKVGSDPRYSREGDDIIVIQEVRFSEAALGAAVDVQTMDGVKRIKIPAGIHPETIRLILRSEARLAKNDRVGARQALEEATARDDRLPSPQLMLATLYDAEGEYDKAIERYRKLQQLAPNNPLVLNNLAYALAVRKNNVEEALPLAEKAYGLAKGNASVSDTLGWIYHLAGQDAKAAKVLEEAVRSGTTNAEMHLHFAVVSAATGNKLAAEIASVLAFSAIRNNDKVGLILFSDEVEKFIPPRKGRRHVLRVIREVLFFQPQRAGTDLNGALEFLLRVTTRKAIVVVISDFIFSRSLASLSI